MTLERLVSIVIPTYNRATMLDKALTTCLNQTYRNIEVIVVDDGSTDSTKEVVQSFARRDNRVRLVSQQNQKLPRALNAGHAAARGDYLTWTSDDNSYDPDAIEIMTSYLDGHPDVGSVYCDYRIVGPDGEALGMIRLPEPDCRDEDLIYGACFLYRRTAFEKVGGYDPEMFLAEDYEFWLRMRRACKVVHLRDCAPYAYGVQDTSLTETRRADITVQAARARAKHEIRRWKSRLVLSRGHFEAGYILRKDRNFGAAIRSLAIAVKLYPFALDYYRCLIGIGLDMLQSDKREQRAKASLAVADKSN